MSESSGFFSENKSRLFIILALTLSCVAVYGQVFSFDFINIDDRAYIYENKAVLSGINSHSIWWAITAFYSGNWHPVTWFTHMLDVSLFGPGAGPMHLTNVFFHTIDAILAFLVFKKFTGKIWESSIVAFLFALHPVHVESVAWIAERRDVLSTFFWLLTMLAYLKYVGLKKSTEVMGGLINKPLFWTIAGLILFACALMSKAMPVTLPFVLLLCDYWPLGRLNNLRDLRPLVAEKLPYFVLTVLSCIITFYTQSTAGATASLQKMPIADRLINVTLSYGKYIVMMFYPVDLGLWYPFDEKVDPFAVIGSLTILIVITAVCWHQRKERRYLMVGWLWFLGTLVPVIGLVQIGMQSLADRYTYVPYFGLFIMLAWGIGDLVKHFKVNDKIVAFAAAIVLVILGMLTFEQVSKWKNSETLYTHTLSFTTRNYFLMSNLCLYYINNSDKPTAERRCTELLEATPESAESYNILGMLRTDIGKFDEAEAFLKRGLQMNPNWAILYLNYSVALSKQGKIEEAENALSKAKSITDGSLSRQSAARACNDLAQAFEKRNQTVKAKEYYSQAVQLDASLAEAASGLRRVSAGN